MKRCDLAHVNNIQCPDVQYRPSFDLISCPLCQSEASPSGAQLHSLSSPGPEFVGEFSLDVQIAHMKRTFDRRREYESAHM